MNLIKEAFMYAILLTAYAYPSQSMISLFIHKYPYIQEALNASQTDTLSKKLQQPGYLLNRIVKSKRVETGVRGVAGIYLGYMSLSDHNGQMIFPRKQQKKAINLLVTRKVQPVYIVAPDTVANWMLDPHEHAEMYSFDEYQDDQTQLYYIKASKAELPSDNMIPLNTIIIIAKPENIFVPLGATITQYSPNLILPQIYTRKHFDISYNALYTLSIKQYFGLVHHEYKQEDETISTILK